MPAVATLEGDKTGGNERRSLWAKSNLISSGQDQMFSASALNCKNVMHFPFVGHLVLNNQMGVISWEKTISYDPILHVSQVQYLGLRTGELSLFHVSISTDAILDQVSFRYLC